ncbi:MAG: dTDP-glucose 4,6-dehydratase [Rhodospirillaceae bacterium TMED8]|nr:dTDP-glucose 4,6-dehydratase [Magnetovibrio sp.]OUT51269.1 MAG: dTDP-glucose 4,6-dehydratase [Rhodospirillaceae bacterium TMED8]
MIHSRILITGGAGFIGSAIVRKLLAKYHCHVLTLDKLTYAGSLSNLSEVIPHTFHQFVESDVEDYDSVRQIIADFRPDGIIHLAAETHVDRSIAGPATFINTNVLGTLSLLEAAFSFWSTLSNEQRAKFRFLHVSTDEVYGDLGPSGEFSEESRYKPNSPYSASKAAADHLVRAWNMTYGLPTLVSNCTNNYGPYQFPEKLIPFMIYNALNGESLPIYGDGLHVRDWLYVDDHANALIKILTNGIVGEVYCIGGNCEISNLEVVESLTSILDAQFPNSPNTPHAQLLRHVSDRPGHDRRYAVNTDKINHELGWTPQETFSSGLEKTVCWYLANTDWSSAIIHEASLKLGCHDLERKADSSPRWTRTGKGANKRGPS